MELYNHPHPLFTHWVIGDGLLKEPFVVIDVGCQGQAHPRWEHLKDHLDFHGFDPIPEVIATLKSQNAGRRNMHFYAIGLGNEDGERQFHVQQDTFSSSFLGAPEPSGRSGNIATGSRPAEIRKLDTLYAKGTIPWADHIKLDCEGFEPEVLKGARQYLQASGALSATIETNFNISPTLPHTHFVAALTEMLPQRLLVADYSFDRVPQPGYGQALAREPWPERSYRKERPHFSPGSPSTHNVLFCRDFVDEAQNPQNFSPEPSPRPLTADRIIKAMIGFELHGLMDRAYAHAEMFAPLLQDRLDVDKAKRLLLTPPSEMRYSPDVVQCLQMVDALRIQLFACEASGLSLMQRLLPFRDTLRKIKRRLRAAR